MQFGARVLAPLQVACVRFGAWTGVFDLGASGRWRCRRDVYGSLRFGVCAAAPPQGVAARCLWQCALI